MALVYSLCSSSKGNCTYVGSERHGILIDAGIGIRTFAAAMTLGGIPQGAVQAIFVTHEHSDHIKGLYKLAERLRVPVYATRGTMEQLVQKGAVPSGADLRIAENAAVCAADMEVRGFFTSHDSAQSAAYRIHTADGKAVCICTDLGYVSQEVEQNLSGSDFVMLESNYDEFMLQTGRYPYFLKKRIAGERGHLSNEACSEQISKLIAQGTTQFLLGHLSEENNRPQVAMAHTVNRLHGEGILLEKDYTLDVAPKSTIGKRILVR